MARTINAPGVEIFERDESESSALQAGTNILVQGFAHQGPTNELILISSKDELNQVFFGGNGPTNDAEQYFYFSCAEVLNSPANLYCIRLPYGLSNGSGFSGKYVALAYGGQIKDTPYTEIVHRNVQVDDFIAGTIAQEGTTETGTKVSLYEFSEKTIKEDDPSTSAFYNALYAYVTANHEDFDPTEETIWDYSSEFDFSTNQFWVSTSGTAEAIDSSKLIKDNPPTYEYAAYNCSAFTVPVSYKYILATAPTADDAAWEETTYGGTFNVTFNNVGTFDKNFFDKVLNGTVTLWDSEINKEKDTDIHALNAFEYFYSNQKLSDTSYILYRIDYGMTKAEWTQKLTTACVDTTISLATRYSDPDLASTFVHVDENTRVNAFDADGNPKLIVDTEEIGNQIVGELMKFTSANPVSDFNIDVSGIPLQDKATQKILYTGPVCYEAVDPQVWYRTYSLDIYNNKLVTDRIKEIDVEQEKKDDEGNVLKRKVLTLNPVPLAVPLTEYQYQAIQEGAITWKDPIYGLDGEGTGEDAFRKILGKSAFYCINKMQTSVDDKYQGFYIAMMDHKKFVESITNPKNSYDAIDEITYVSTPDQAGNVSIEELPDTTLNFDLTGPTSLSTNIMEAASELDLADESNFSNIVVSTVRLGRRASSSDPSKLSYDLKSVTIGSFDVASTIVDPVTKATVPNRIDTRMATNDYIEFVLNPAFDIDANRPKEVVFGGADRPKLDQQSGTCCSLGLEIPCIEDNKAEYIGSVPGKIEKALTLCDNVYDFDLDILIDAGLSTIWAYVKEEDKDGAAEFNASKYIENNVGTPYELLTRSTEEYAESPYYLAFDSIRKIFNDFCQNTRKDCMYLLDPLRAVFVRGKDSKILGIDGKNFTMDVYRPLRNLFSNANSSYGASYANWVKIYDSFNNEYIWMPSSPFEAAIMARVDAAYHPWYAPYGLNNGILSSISDIAVRFSPKQQDSIYKMGLNMFVFFNGDGFVSWGQKTLQTKASAFDRINVRRLFLTLERSTFKTVRYFIAEPNTAFTRTRVVSALTPFFDIAKNNEGCYDYKIYCNDTNNPAQVIDNNELVVDAYIKPTRVIDYVLVTFHATKTDANFDELFNG